MPRRPPAVARVLHRVAATAREHELFSPGEDVLVAVSGGPDSMCLLHSLHLLRRLLRIEIAVFHFDHRLRPDSGEDAAYVRRAAENLGMPFHLRAATGSPERGDSVERWARAARWAAADDVRRDHGYASVALGHTTDDQAETALLALLRGGGLDFVAGMPYRDDAGRVRPLLDVRRSEVEAFTRALRLRPRMDPTNTDTRLLRNAIRHEVIPALERATGRDVRVTLARTAALLRIDAEELARQAAAATAGIVEDEPDGGLLLDAARLVGLPTAVAARVVESTMWRRGIQPELETIRAILDLAADPPQRGIDLPGPFTATREREYIRLSRPSPESPSGAEQGEADADRGHRTAGGVARRRGRS